MSFGSFSESKFLVQKALISTEKTQEFENDSSNGLVDKNMHTYEWIQLLYYLFVGFIWLCLRLIVLSMSILQLSKRFLNELWILYVVGRNKIHEAITWSFKPYKLGYKACFVTGRQTTKCEPCIEIWFIIKAPIVQIEKLKLEISDVQNIRGCEKKG